MILEAIALNKRYGSRTALESVSFSLDKGEVVGFLGGNGAGKSTTMRIMAGFIAPTGGQARIGGRDPVLPGVREKIGYLPEANPLPPAMRVGEYLRFRAGLKGLPRAQRAHAAGEAAERCRIGHALSRLIGQLSKGNRQRVGLADCLLARPEVLLLDEPTAGLDPRQAAETRELVAELGREATVLLSSHILHDIERLCRRVVILDRGRVAADGDLDAICRASVEERILHIAVLAPEPARETFLTVPGVRPAAPVENAGPEAAANDPDGIVSGETPQCFRLAVPAGADVRREISRLAVDRSWLITEMRLEPIRFEDIFNRLTDGSAKNAATDAR